LQGVIALIFREKDVKGNVIGIKKIYFPIGIVMIISFLITSTWAMSNVGSDNNNIMLIISWIFTEILCFLLELIVYFVIKNRDLSITHRLILMSRGYF
jgi:hypothetical protein